MNGRQDLRRNKNAQKVQQMAQICSWRALHSSLRSWYVLLRGQMNVTIRYRILKTINNYQVTATRRVIILIYQLSDNNFIGKIAMNRVRPYINRFVKQKQLQIVDIYHDQKMKEMKPVTSKLMEHSQIFTINNSKKEMTKEVRDFEIERENRLLLCKIESVMTKKGNYSVARTKSINTKCNKSLNQIFRKKQLQNIELENKRFLMRLQSKKPTLNTIRLRKDWEDNKSVIKRMANCEFNLTQFKIKDSRVRSMTTQRMYKQKYQDLKISRIKTIDGHKMLVKIQFADGFLKIVGDSKDHKDLKVIQIPRDEAVVFIEKDCQGKIQNLFQKLKFDAFTETLYLVSENIQSDLSDLNPQGKTKSNLQDRRSSQKINKSTLQHNAITQQQEIGRLHQTIPHRPVSMKMEKWSLPTSSKKIKVNRQAISQQNKSFHQQQGENQHSRMQYNKEQQSNSKGRRQMKSNEELIEQDL